MEKTEQLTSKRGPKYKPEDKRRSPVSVMFSNAEIKALGGRDGIRLFCQDAVTAEASRIKLNDLALKTKRKKSKQ